MKTIIEIFLVFAKVGALTFGGGYTMLPLLHKEIAEKRGWNTIEEITDYYALSQCLPGLIAIKTAALLGHRRKGGAGAFAAALGVAFPALAASLLIAMYIEYLLAFEMARHALGGIRVAVLVLVTDAIIKMWKAGVKGVWGVGIFVLTFVVFTFFSLSPALPIVFGAVCGLVIKQFVRERAAESD